MPIDVTLTATARHDLLKQMLESFDWYVRSNMDIGNVYINIDRIYGDEVEQSFSAAVRAFSSSKINVPEEPGHAAAIKWLWSHDLSDTFLHLEDDYTFIKSVFPVQLQPPVGAHALLYPQLGWRDGPYLINSKGDHQFGMSPRFLRADFAKQYAYLLELDRCPEKQRYRNRALHDLCKQWHCTVEHQRGNLLHHAGATWNAQNGVTRIVNEGTIERYQYGKRIT